MSAHLPSAKSGFGAVLQEVAAHIPQLLPQFGRQPPPVGVEPKVKPIDPALLPNRVRQNSVTVAGTVEKVRFVEEGEFAGWYYLTVRPDHISKTMKAPKAEDSLKLLTRTPFEVGQEAIFTSVKYESCQVEKGPHKKTLFVAECAIVGP